MRHEIIIVGLLRDCAIQNRNAMLVLGLPLENKTSAGTAELGSTRIYKGPYMYNGIICRLPSI